MNIPSQAKGQLISKANCQAEDSPKNERMNSFLLLCDVFSFVFWENPRLDWFNSFVKLFKLELILVTKFEDVPPGLIPIEIYGLTDCYLEKRAGNYYYYTLCPRPLIDMVGMAA